MTNLFTWAYTRLYVFPVHVIWRGVMIGARELATAPGAPGMEAFTAAAGGDEYTRGHLRAPAASAARGPLPFSLPFFGPDDGFVVPRDLGSGRFDLLANLFALPTHETIPMWWSATLFLGALALMNLIWYLMFWHMLYRMVVDGDTPNETGEDVYEGDKSAKKE